MIILAYNSPSFMLWRLRNKWNNCMMITNDMHFIISYIYRECNILVDKLANIGLNKIYLN